MKSDRPSSKACMLISAATPFKAMASAMATRLSGKSLACHAIPVMIRPE